MRRFLYAPPLEGLQAGRFARGLENLGHRLDGRTGSAYLLKARKRVYALTPIHPRRRRARAVARALAEPT